ncbi:uncharacterized protein K489DRAFT_375523 [Dissoconium aciculare CBS 342.82]|uniref:Uncharacterized protein n=1 Tax=Dissoconium aciculare CBS 342.82 TaxID=1314786 RepID=A0A6J3MHJ8_9PEZI|nr:uncharacterized protein K489DRAFT_375523 [Dissoconium aciculare CBS 342.82]KAF1827431.1 hypothetical protein K489DRAFT_375523 [Dissoconium aciculare CBS 342.82]
MPYKCIPRNNGIPASKRKIIRVIVASARMCAPRARRSNGCEGQARRALLSDMLPPSPTAHRIASAPRHHPLRSLSSPTTTPER